VSLQRSCRHPSWPRTCPPLRGDSIEEKTSDLVLDPGPNTSSTGPQLYSGRPPRRAPIRFRRGWLPSLPNRGTLPPERDLDRTLAFYTASAACLPREAGFVRWPSAQSAHRPPERGWMPTGACVRAAICLPRETDPLTDVATADFARGVAALDDESSASEPSCCPRRGRSTHPGHDRRNL